MEREIRALKWALKKAHHENRELMEAKTTHAYPAIDSKSCQTNQTLKTIACQTKPAMSDSDCQTSQTTDALFVTDNQWNRIGEKMIRFHPEEMNVWFKSGRKCSFFVDIPSMTEKSTITDEELLDCIKLTQAKWDNIRYHCSQEDSWTTGDIDPIWSHELNKQILYIYPKADFNQK